MCPNSNNQNDNNIINRQNKTTTALKSQTSLSTQKLTNIPKNVMKKSFIEKNSFIGQVLLHSILFLCVDQNGHLLIIHHP